MPDAWKRRAELTEELRALRLHLADVTARRPAGAPPPPSSVADDPRYRWIVENLRALIVETDAHGRTVYVSPTVTELLGYRPEELLHQQGSDWVHDDDLPELREVSRGLRETGQLHEAVYRARHKDGHWVWLQTTGVTSYRTPEGSLRTVSFSRDVSELKRTAEALRESEERYRVLTEHTLDIVSESDEEGRLVYTSAATQAVLGYRPEELVGTTPLLLIHPDDVETCAARFLDTLQSRAVVRSAPYRVRHRAGSWRWLEGAGVALRKGDGAARVLSITRDVTERVEAERERAAFEERVRQTQKLETLGVMAGGIAHDFNNLLTPILGNASLALMDLDPESPVRAHLEKIRKAAHRAAALTHQMLTYAGQGPLLIKRLDLSQLVRAMAQLLETAVSGRAVLVLELAEGLPPLEGDAAQLSQVVMNLVSNAAEATRRPGAHIALRTGATEGTEALAHRTTLGERLGSGPYVYLEVRDNGCGMDAETRSRIFDPFFTTKFTGRGIGLPAVAGIVSRHGGAAEIESELGRGTRFRVLFPAAERAPAATPP